MDEGGRRRWVSRRRFMGRSALALAAGAAWLVACRGGDKPAPTPGVAAAPRRGGTLTWGQWDSNEEIDPATPSGAAALEVIGNVLDPIVMMDAEQKFYPALASHWTIDPDARRYTFTMRDGVKFHDGSVLEASAVKRSWERILDPATKAAGVANLFGPIDAISAPDPRTLVVTFKDPNPLFLLEMWRPYFGVLSPRLLDALKPGEKVTTLVGSGPFRHMGRSADGVVTLEAFPDYAWGAETLKNRQAPYLQTVKFRSVPESATRLATLESGENLLIDEIAEPDYARVKEDRRFRFVETLRRGLSIGFFINVERPPVNEVAVREALNWAVDRKAIVERLFFGVHKVAVGPLSDGVWGRLEELEKRFTYDPKKAAQLLEGAGWRAAGGGIREKDGQKLSLVLATFRSPWSEIADALQGQFRDVGIDLQVQKMARGPYLDFVRDYRHHLCASAGTGLDASVLRERYHSAAVKTTNFANLKDPQLDALFNKGAQQALGSVERRRTYEDVQRRLMELLPFVSVLSQLRVEAMSSRLHDLRMGPDGLNALPLTDAWLEA